MTVAVVKKHLDITGTISIREAMDDYGMSGGSLTKYISILRRQNVDIERVFLKHPITGKRYARYYLIHSI